MALAQYAAGNLLASGSLTPARRSALEACLDCTSLSPDAACLPAWRAAATLLFTQKNELYASVNVRQGFPPTNAALKARMLSMLRTLGADESLCEQLLELKTLPDPRLR